MGAKTDDVILWPQRAENSEKLGSSKGYPAKKKFTGFPVCASCQEQSFWSVLLGGRRIPVLLESLTVGHDGTRRLPRRLRSCVSQRAHGPTAKYLAPIELASDASSPRLDPRDERSASFGLL